MAPLQSALSSPNQLVGGHVGTGCEGPSTSGPQIMMGTFQNGGAQSVEVSHESGQNPGRFQGNGPQQQQQQQQQQRQQLAASGENIYISLPNYPGNSIRNINSLGAQQISQQQQFINSFPTIPIPSSSVHGYASSVNLIPNINSLSSQSQQIPQHQQLHSSLPNPISSVHSYGYANNLNLIPNINSRPIPSVGPHSYVNTSMAPAASLFHSNTSNVNIMPGISANSIGLGGGSGYSTINSIPSLSSLTSVCSPLGEDLSQSIRDKIRRGEFVDFSSLLPLDGGDPGSGDGSASRVVGFNDQGHMVLQEPRHSIKLLSLSRWTSAFFVYASVFLSSHPNRNLEILKYGDLVRQAATRFGNGWREYDRQFRLRQMRHPERSWAMIDNELWALYVAVPMDAPSTQGSNSNVLNANSQVSDTPQAQNPYTHSVRDFSAPEDAATQKICFAFNQGRCRYKVCKYAHSCRNCGKKGHSAAICWSKSGQNTQSNQGGAQDRS